MDNLVEFLLARIAEDEAVARAAINPERPGTHWHWVMDGNNTPVRQGHLQGAQDSQTVSLRTVEESPSTVGPFPHFVIDSLDDVHPGGGEHIARWDPARVRAECEAKRQVVELMVNEVKDARRRPGWTLPDSEMDEKGRDYRVGFENARGQQLPDVLDRTDRVLRRLALPYADHPDYRKEWRP